MTDRRYIHFVKKLPPGFSRIRKPKGDRYNRCPDLEVVHEELVGRYGTNNVVYVGGDARYFVFGVRTSVLRAAGRDSA